MNLKQISPGNLDAHVVFIISCDSYCMWFLDTIRNLLLEDREGPCHLSNPAAPGIATVGELHNKVEKTLAGLAQWIEHGTMKQRIPSSIPSQSTCVGCGPSPQLGACERQLISISLMQGQDGGLGRYTVPHTAKRRTTTNLKTHK